MDIPRFPAYPSIVLPIKSWIRLIFITRYIHMQNLERTILCAEFIHKMVSRYLACPLRVIDNYTCSLHQLYAKFELGAVPLSASKYKHTCVWCTYTPAIRYGVRLFGNFDSWAKQVSRGNCNGGSNIHENNKTCCHWRINFHRSCFFRGSMSGDVYQDVIIRTLQNVGALRNVDIQCSNCDGYRKKNCSHVASWKNKFFN